MEWKENLLDGLKLEFKNGGSATEIAKALTTKFNEEISRNAVLGKLNRLKLHRKRNPPDVKEVKPRRSRKMMVVRSQSPPTIIKWEVEPPSVFRCSIDQLNKDRCHWPFGDSPPYMYCGAAVANRGYCYFHYQRSLRSREWERYENGYIRNT